MSGSLLADVTAALEAAGVRYALIGAGALAVHGISRSTFDLDLFTSDMAALGRATWARLEQDARVQVDLRLGEADDPLAGVVRFARAGERDVDVVVGRSVWQTEIVERAEAFDLSGVRLPVVRAADLILLKLYAGGSQDLWDVAQLLAAEDRPALEAEVESRLERLPAECCAAWVRVAGD